MHPEVHRFSTGWRKISFYFNLSYEIKDKTIEFDDNRNVQRAEFVVRAYMQYVVLAFRNLLVKFYLFTDCFRQFCH